jgi:dTDP-glucose 4,6-dehydratase/UDP-glucose 4-epimerase
MTFLIIGSAGFIGGHVAQYFHMAGNGVYACDIIDNPGVSNFVKLEPANPDYELLFRQHKYDVCINCSGAAHIQKSFDNTLYDFELNTVNVIKILDAIRKHNPACKFLNISSAAVYGNPAALPVSEDSDLSPISPYGYHKLIAEIILDEYYRLWNIPVCSARIFSAYGEGLKKQLLFDLSRKIMFDDEIHLFGTGEESRDFIHIDDICRALECIVKNDNFRSSRINVANGEQVTVFEIVKIFKDAWRHNKKIIFDNIEKTGDPVNWAADINILKSYGYEQKVSIREGIARYISWIKNERLG